MNLATIGFLIAGLIFAVYAYSFFILAGKSLPVFLKSYALAYLALAVAFLVWAYASLNPDFLTTSILIGDSLILLGSICLFNILFTKNQSFKIFSIIVGLILSIFFIWVRINYFSPAPYLSNGILVFNTQKTIAIILDLIFILIWLPANILAAKQVTAKMSITGMDFAYSAVYVFSTISAILLITFKTAPMVILAFVTLGVCFIMLLYSNYVINKLLPK